jgi:hypothetical protein
MIDGMFNHLQPYNWIVALVAIGLLLPYVVGPILIRRSVTQKLDPDLVPFPPDHPSLPADVAQHFREATRQLVEAGFEVLTGFGLPRQTPRVRAVLILFANRVTKEAAMATAMYGDLPDGPQLQTAYVEIISLFRDGALVQTNNSRVLGAFPKRPGVFTTQFPQVHNIARLVTLHRALVERYGGVGEKRLRLDEEFHGDARAYLAACMREELERQVPNGYMFLSESEGLFRPTWKGAFLMTWKQLFPFKQLREAYRDRRAKQLVAEIEGQGKLDI